MRCRPLVCLLLLAVAVPAFAADDRSPLTRARQLYNLHDYARALQAADEAHRAPEHADSADLIGARALLERYRDSADAADLLQARERLRRVAPERFTERERVEWVVGLGEALFFDGAPGAAAAVFDSVLQQVDAPLADGRERVLDWWATAVDQDARPRGDADRQRVFRSMGVRMRDELGRRPASTTAAYWLVVAARGQGDPQGAWDAALAAWVRAPLAADHGGKLRADLDTLVLRAVIPERAGAIGQPVDTLREEWEQFKGKWNR